VVYEIGTPLDTRATPSTSPSNASSELSVAPTTMQIVRLGGGSKHASIAAFRLHEVLEQIRWGDKARVELDGKRSKPKVFYSAPFFEARTAMEAASAQLSQSISDLVEQRSRLSLEVVLEVAVADHVRSSSGLQLRISLRCSW